MKSGIVLSLTLAAALPLVAGTATDNVVGLIRVDSSAEETIVSIPFVATSASATDAAIPVADIVKTANLAEGDLLEYYNATEKKYEVWRLTVVGGDKIWQAATSFGEGEMSVATSTLARGNAIVLVRKSPGSCFYLQGQVAKSGSATCTMAQGSATAPAYSLIAPPSDKAVSLNDGTWENIGAGDYVLVNGKMFKYDSSNGGWGTETYSNFVRSFTPMTDEEKISAGQGAWYVSAKGAVNEAKVTWTGLPAVRLN